MSAEEIEKKKKEIEKKTIIIDKIKYLHPLIRDTEVDGEDFGKLYDEFKTTYIKNFIERNYSVDKLKDIAFNCLRLFESSPYGVDHLSSASLNLKDVPKFDIIVVLFLYSLDLETLEKIPSRYFY